MMVVVWWYNKVSVQNYVFVGGLGGGLVSKISIS